MISLRAIAGRAAGGRSALWAPMAVLVWMVWGLVTGEKTLFFRDVFNLHLPAKLAQAEAWREGTLPFVDPYRAGGQPSLGNPNLLPLYPDNLLYLLGSDLWAFNAHFWIHLLLAPIGCYWLARQWRLSRVAAAASGVTYGFSGYLLSQMNFYNLVASAALTPFLVASALEIYRTTRRGRSLRKIARAVALFALLLALLLLGGEPILAAVALVMAVVATVFAALHVESSSGPLAQSGLGPEGARHRRSSSGSSRR